MPAAVDQSASCSTDRGAPWASHRPLRPNSYRLTHPKNYVGVPLAVAATTPAEVLIDKYLVAMAGAAKIGARALGYLSPSDHLTATGEELVATATDVYNGPKTALAALATDDIRYGQFDTAAPELASIGREPLADHPGVRLVVDALDTHGPLSLSELTVACFERAPEQAVGFLLVSDDDLIDAVTAATPTDPPAELETPEAYPSETAYQFKSVLAHFGILTTPGADSATLDPTSDTWELGAAAKEVRR